MTTQTKPKSKKTRKPSVPFSNQRKTYFAMLKSYATRMELKADTATRHEVTIEALGISKSSKDFDDTDWDIILGFLRHRNGGAAGEWTAVHRVAIEIDGKRRRKLYRIRKEIPEKYLTEISLDKFKTTDYDSLTLPELDQLRITAIERARTAKRNGRQLK